MELVNQRKAIQLLKKYSLKLPKTVILDKPDFTKINLKFPVVLKIDSPEVVHKSDFGLVTTGIISVPDVRKSIDWAITILKMYGIKEYRFVLQETVKGQEFLIGMKRDPTFGPVIMFGLGGVFVEIMKDVSMRIAPLTKKDCKEMINEIKAKKL